MEYTVTSLNEFVDCIESLREGFDPRKTFFFRGVPDCDFSLLPSVYRRNVTESNLAHQFRARALVMEATPSHNELDYWLFLMQHHGLPTRLLDWSEAPFIALFFSLSGNADADACVYAIDPMELNKKVMGGNWFPDRQDPTYLYRFYKAFYSRPFKLPWNIKIDPNEVREMKLPLAIRPTIIHNRMVSQRSAFTIHGDDKRGIEDIGAVKIHKIIIPLEFKHEINSTLKVMGISNSTVFPDLEGLAAELIS